MLFWPRKENGKDSPVAVMNGILTVDEIDLTDALPLRSKVLRNGMPPEQCTFLQDGTIEALHFGLRENGEIVAIASFYNRPLELEKIPPDSEPKKSLPARAGFQLRGMAVTIERQGNGLGKILLEEALKKVVCQWSPRPEYVWCYAVDTATGFYERRGFVSLSDGFEMPYIGLLHTMFRMIAS